MDSVFDVLSLFFFFEGLGVYWLILVNDFKIIFI